MNVVPAGQAPCAQACPAGIDVPGYLRRIAEGNPQAAYEIILESVPFPGVLGRVCTRPCESACRRGDVNEPIAICSLKRFAAEHAAGRSETFSQTEAGTGRTIAVVGSGPAGLTAAYHLRKKGHSVTVYEGRDQAGGAMRYGIPRFRLPEDVLDKEIQAVLDLGIDLKTGAQVGVEVTLDELRKNHDAVFLALGLPTSRKLGIDGASLEDVHWGEEFLRSVNSGTLDSVKERVLVIGGGNVAVDVARTARRLGAQEVTMACLENRQEMPAGPWELDPAEEEGVQVLPSWGPRRVLGENGHVSGVELIECLRVFNDEGRFAPVTGEATRIIEVDQVVFAIGQSADLSCLAGDGECRIENDLIVIDDQTMETSMPGVFAGGDVATGPGTIVGAIASGRRVADAIDRHLGGSGIEGTTATSLTDYRTYDPKRAPGFADLLRSAPPSLPVDQRSRGFEEVERCFAVDQAATEAKRCLQCDLEKVIARSSNS